jgi:WD40 repeat protein
MGVDYDAEHESLKNRVALKVMHPRLRASAGFLRRFHNEARSAAQLHHTNIVSVFDYGEHDGVCYYAMQYIAGHSLDEILIDVRRLRSNQGPVKATPAEAGQFTSEKGNPRSRAAVGGAAGIDAAAATDPLMRAVTHGLMTGEFASGAGVTVDHDAAPPPTAEAISPPPEACARTAATYDVEFELVQPRAPASPPARDYERDASESAAGLSSSSLAGPGEDRYHREVARLGAQIADALAHAHKRGMLHRDIKPSNLLLDAVGNIWVTDFGLAKFEEGEDLSRTRDVVGTLRYMAPERFRGVSDRRCDLYALGATLYELLTFRPAFESHDRLRLMDQIAKEPPAPPRQLDRRIPRDLETIVLKALAKDPKDRFATADELGAELRRFVENRPIRSRPIPAYERLWRWCKRNPGLATANIAAALLTTVLAIGSTIAAWTYHGQRNELRFEKRLTEVNLKRAEHAEHHARLALGQSLLSEGAALQRTGLFGQRFDSLDRLGQSAQRLRGDPDGRKRLPEIRNNAIAAMGLVDLRVRRERDCGGLGLSVSAALEQYAVSDRSGAFVVRRLDNDGELFRIPGEAHRNLPFGWQGLWLGFSPSGELLIDAYGPAADKNGLLEVWLVNRRELIGTVPIRGLPAFHPDGERLLIPAPEGDIAVWDRLKRRVVRRLPVGFPLNSCALDGQGRLVAVTSDDEAPPRAAVLEFDTGRLVAEWRNRDAAGLAALSADGRLLAVGGSSRDPRVHVWNVCTGGLCSVLEGHTSEIIGIEFAHAGYLLATTSWDWTTRLWDALSGEALVVAPGMRMGFSPDDKRLAFKIGQNLGTWDVATGAECRVLQPAMLGNRSEAKDIIQPTCAQVSPDSRLIATCDAGGVCLWEAGTGRELAHLKTGACESVLFHPDGRSLISSGAWGLYRWPISSDHVRVGDSLLIGPPELLRETTGNEWRRAIWMPDHRTLALVDNGNARVLLIDSRHPNPAWSRATALDSGGNRWMTSVAVSPDGHWLAAGSWREPGVRVWDVRRRRLERILAPRADEANPSNSYFVGFSADGRWLVLCAQAHTARNAYYFWHVGTWERGERIDQERNGTAWRPPAFTCDGRLMALGIAPD